MRYTQVKRKILIYTLFNILLVSNAGAGDKPYEGDSVNNIPEFDCVIEPSEIVAVGSPVPGVIETIHVHRSDPVQKGAVIAELESSVERATLVLAKARAELTTLIEVRQENAAFERRTQRRNQALFQKSSLSAQDMDKLMTETRIAQLQVRQEKDNKLIAELEYRRAQAALQRRTIRSPVEGVVMERFKSVGEYVENEPVLRIAQLDPLHVEVIIPVNFLGRIKPGMRAEVTPVVPGFGKYLATVKRVDGVADAASGTFGAWLSLRNPDYAIPGGLRCRLGFLLAEEPAGPVTTRKPVIGKGSTPHVSFGAGVEPSTPVDFVAASSAP